MSNGFVHSVKVPRLYKLTAKTVQTVEEEGASIKQLIYQKKHPNLPAIYALAVTTIQHGPQLNHLLRKTQLLFKEPRFDPWLARVLITELLWGKKSLPPQAKPIKIILSYEKELREESKNLEKTDIKLVDNSNKVPRYVRINTLVKSVEDSICSFTEEGWTLLPKSQKYSTFLKTLASLGEETFIQDFHIPELFAFPPGTHFHDHPGYQCGAIVLQDKASCLPSYFLNPTPGSTVLDMCSAPGMKTTHLAAIMKNTGKILAVERHNRRYKTLCEMIKTYTADCVETINTDAMTLDPKLYSNIEYILVDPSCSGSGMLDRISLGKADSKCAPGRLMSLQSFQVLLLRHALLNFPMVKRVVYSTCSMYPEENEMVIDEILEDVDSSYDLVPVRKLIGPEWKNFSSMDYKCKDRCLYAKPDVDMCNGFFVAVFERNFDVPLPEYKRKDAVKRGKNNDQLKSEEGKDDVGSQLERKKNLKRRQSNGASDNGSKIAKVEGELEVEFDENEMQDEGEPPKKEKKKKRREAKWEIIDISQHVEVKSELPVDKKKKKKKKKKQGDVETLEEEMNGTSETLQVEEPKIKKKKKTKRSEVKILEEIIPTTTISDDEKSKKKKKKKKDNTET